MVPGEEKVIRYEVSRQEDTADEQALRSAAEMFCAVYKEEPWNEEWDPDEVIRMLQDATVEEGGVLIFALSGTKVVGITFGRFIQTQEIEQRIGQDPMLSLSGREKLYYVSEVSVDYEARRHGIGRALTAKLIETAESLGAKRFILRTNVNAIPARTLYAKAGFVETDWSDIEFPDRTYWIR